MQYLVTASSPGEGHVALCHYLRGMSMFSVGNKVKINPAVLEDEEVKSSHHLFREALKHNVTGTVVELDQERSKPLEFWYRVRFHFFTAPMKENHIVLLSKE